jgi:molecular chaperone GrpE (heat shock protein)
MLIIVLSTVNSYSIISRYSTSNSIYKYNNIISNSRYHRISNGINSNRRLYSNNDDSNNSDEVEDNDNNDNNNTNEVTDDNIETDATDTEEVANTEEVAPLTPEEQAILNKEKELKNQLENLENQLRKARADLVRVKDKISESGKNGYFIQQAQVAEFLKKKDAEQKERVQRNKRDFVMKMLPVVDLFREAPIKAVANTDREEQMHKNFGSLLTSILTVFEKYGYKEFHPEIAAKYEPSKHQVNEMVVDPENDGLVVEVIHSGWSSDDADVIKRAVVNVGKKE